MSPDEEMIASNIDHWKKLESNPRFMPFWPADPVVRFFNKIRRRSVDGEMLRDPGRALDIGIGSGRHLGVAQAAGYSVAGTIFADDYKECPMNSMDEEARRYFVGDRIPWGDCTFDAVLCWGVIYYSTYERMSATVDEIFRVLKTGGKACVLFRTLDDSRMSMGDQRMAGALGEPVASCLMKQNDTNEEGLLITFVGEKKIREFGSRFNSYSYEQENRTFRDRTRVHSDWVVEFEK